MGILLFELFRNPLFMGILNKWETLVMNISAHGKYRVRRFMHFCPFRMKDFILFLFVYVLSVAKTSKKPNKFCSYISFDYLCALIWVYYILFRPRWATWRI